MLLLSPAVPFSASPILALAIYMFFAIYVVAFLSYIIQNTLLRGNMKFLMIKMIFLQAYSFGYITGRP